MKNLILITLTLLFGLNLLAQTQCPDNIVDYDGNVYQTVQIGKQCWMAENLKSTHTAKGKPIERQCYNNDSINCNIYGGLYDWWTIMQGGEGSMFRPVPGICPDGWSIPADNDYYILNKYILNNTKATNYVQVAMELNKMGLILKPVGGEIIYTTEKETRAVGQSIGLNSQGFWWTNSGYHNKANYNTIDKYTKKFSANRAWKTTAMSVRCIKK